jgi:hypothetical protein
VRDKSGIRYLAEVRKTIGFVHRMHRLRRKYEADKAVTNQQFNESIKHFDWSKVAKITKEGSKL